MLPLLLRHRESFQAIVDVHLGVDILNAVILELRPVCREVRRQVSDSHPIGFCGLAGHGKQLDEPFALFVLLLICLQHRANILQGQRQGQRCCHDHRADPVIRRQETPRFEVLPRIVLVQIAGKIHTFKCSIVSNQLHAAVLECIQKLLRKRFPCGNVCTLCFSKATALVCCPCDQQDLRAEICRIAVQTAFSDVYLTVSFNIDQYFFQILHPDSSCKKERPESLSPVSVPCVILSGDTPAVPRRHRHSELPRHPPEHQNQTQQMHGRTDARRP